MATSKKPKQLTAAELSKLNSALDGQKAIYILGNKYEVLIDTHFRESKLNKVAMKYLSIIQSLQHREEIDDETIANTLSLLHPLILKEFTNLPLSEIDTIEDLIKVQTALLDTGILVEVFNALPEKEVKKLTDKVDQLSKNIGQVMGELAVRQSLEGVDTSGNNEHEATGSSDK